MVAASTSHPQPEVSLPNTELEKYKLDRNHELELNKFSHNLEIERLKVLSYLNGGAIGVYIALFSTVFKDLSLVSIVISVLAVVFWLIGLSDAAKAIQFNLDAQVAFTSAYHKRRRAAEWRLLAKEDYPPSKLKQIIGESDEPLSSTELKDANEYTLNEIKYDKEADKKIADGRGNALNVRLKAGKSIDSFVLGAASATIAFLLNDVFPM